MRECCRFSLVGALLTLLLAANAARCADSPSTLEKLPNMDGFRSPMAPKTRPGQAPSWTDKIKDGWNSFTAGFTPKPKVEPANDPTSLKTPGRAGANSRMAMARMFEQSGRLKEAGSQYELALADSPKDGRVLLAYARLKVRMGDLAGACTLYERGAKVSPKEAAIYNDWGLCLGQRQMFTEAAAKLDQAVQLQPHNVLYRNNLATVLVDAGQIEAAFGHLSACHPEPVAHYNLGYLLYRKGDQAAAARQFGLALEKDPKFAAAGYWLQRLRASPGLPGPEPQSVAHAVPPEAAWPTAPHVTHSFAPQGVTSSTVPMPPSGADPARTALREPPPVVTPGPSGTAGPNVQLMPPVFTPLPPVQR